MYIKNRVLSLVIRSIGLIIGLSGIFLISSLGGQFSFATWLYYTLMSNILVCIYLAFCIVRGVLDIARKGPHGDSQYYPKISMVLSVDILLTMAVFWIMLAPTMFSMSSSLSLFSFENIVCHTVTPIVMILDYLIFNKRRTLRVFDPAFVTVFPLAYTAFAMILGTSGYVFSLDLDGNPVHFPYYFLDIYNLGWMVLPYILLLAALLVGVGYICYLFDRKGPTKEILLRKRD